MIRPQIVVAMGATAGQALLGRARAVRVMAARGRLREDPRGFRAMITVHPSFLLRVPDADAKARAYGDFVRDLRLLAA